jgi:hypothetical protein
MMNQKKLLYATGKGVGSGGHGVVEAYFFYIWLLSV